MFGDAAQGPQALGALEVPDDVPRQVADLLGKFDAPGLPAGGRADPLQRGAQGVLEAARFLRSVADRLDQLWFAQAAWGRGRHFPM